jgi:hypothetical protein
MPKRYLAIIGFFIIFLNFYSLYEASAGTKDNVKYEVFKYPFLGKYFNLGMDKNSMIKLYGEMEPVDPSELSSKENKFKVFSIKYSSWFYFKDNKLVMASIKYRNEDILDLPEKWLNKKYGKDRIIKETPNWVTQWKTGYILITRTDFPVSETGDSESDVLIEYLNK